MTRNQIVLVGGGSRSGKSRFALYLAERLGKRRLFVATGQAKDAEMAERIRLHRQSRGPGFATLEEPLKLTEALHAVQEIDVVVIDCLTLWLTNLLLGDKTRAQLDADVHALCQVLERRAFHAIVVTNEVGLGIVPETALGRLFRDVAGSAHQQLSQVADEVYFSVLGTLLRLKPDLAPVPWEGKS